VGIVSVVAATSGTTLVQTAATRTARAQTPAPAAPPLEALETLTATESDILEAIVARLIPTDDNGPGASEARAAHYIDRALAGPLSASRRAYAAGLAAVDAYTQSAKGAPFAKLVAQDRTPC
jgi:gluconate 2-dehydrogenase gamma chain